MNPASAFSPRKRAILGIGCILLALALLAGAGSIPFAFESSTLFYKFGIEKASLRAGKVLGMAAAVLLFLQVVLVSRFRLLDRIFALDRLYAFHRANGVVIAVLVLMHPVLILASEGFTIFPFEKRYWPEFLGVGLSLAVVATVTVSRLRAKLAVPYHVWLRLHRIATPAVIAAAGVHILYVSETFESGLPRTLVLIAGGLVLVLLLRIHWRRRFPGKRRFAVAAVGPAGENAHVIDLRPAEGPIFAYLPGQFVFITPLSKHLPPEEHPFTLASSPSRNDAIQLVVRSLGDWTRNIAALRPDEPVHVDGPYGLFSYRAFPGDHPLILIAGGIGITPMLSMLRHMADSRDPRPVLLVWSNSTRASAVLPDAFDDLSKRLRRLTIVHVITRGSAEGGVRGRLDASGLDRLLEGWDRDARVFVCGPPGMMRSVVEALRTSGFRRSRIHTERFGF